MSDQPEKPKRKHPGKNFLDEMYAKGHVAEDGSVVDFSAKKQADKKPAEQPEKKEDK